MPIPVQSKPSRRRLLGDVVFEKLLRAIESGELQPGELLSDSAIEQWVGASRTPVREAIDRLAAIWLIEIMPQRGTRVAEVDPVRARESFEVLGALARATAEVVVPILSVSQQRLVLAQVRRQRGARAADFLGRDGLLDLLVGSLGNIRLRQAWDELVPQVTRRWNVEPGSEPSGPVDRVLDDLRDALTSADGARAAELLGSWFENADQEARRI